MPIYADLWPRRAGQVAAYLLVLGWCLLWVRVAQEALGRWLPARLAWARDAGATRLLLNTPDGLRSWRCGR